MLMGPPAAGKSGWARRSGLAVVATDDVREELGAPMGGRGVFEEAYRRVAALLVEGRSVVFDSTGLNPSVRARLRELASACGAEAHLVVVHAEDGACRRRDRQRQVRVPRRAMADMLEQYRREFPVATGGESWASVEVVNGGSAAARRPPEVVGDRRVKSFPW